jgi:hypothetical protein
LKPAKNLVRETPMGQLTAYEVGEEGGPMGKGLGAENRPRYTLGAFARTKQISTCLRESITR